MTLVGTAQSYSYFRTLTKTRAPVSFVCTLCSTSHPMSNTVTKTRSKKDSSLLKCQDELQPSKRRKATTTCLRPPFSPSSKESQSKNSRSHGNGPHLFNFLSVYKGLDDWHMPIFRNVCTYLQQKREQTTMPSSLSSSFSPVVLYPGSGRHITASLIFCNVVYVDMDRKLRDFFQDERVME